MATNPFEQELIKRTNPFAEELQKRQGGTANDPNDRSQHLSPAPAQTYHQMRRKDIMYKDDSGQQVMDLDARKAKHGIGGVGLDVFPVIGPAADWLGQSMLKGASSLARGLLSFPLDLVGADEAAESVRKAIPKVKGGDTGTDTAGTALQYVAPATASYKAASAAASALTKSRPLKYLSGLGGAAAGDAAVTVPDEASTLGNFFGGGATEINPDDSALERRAKVGAEALAAGVVGDAAVRGVGKIVDTVTSKNIKQAAGETLRKGLRTAGEDPEAVANRLDEVASRQGHPEEAGFKPTSGTASDSNYLLSVERGVSTRPEMVTRFDQNKEALTRASLEAIETTGNPEDAVRFFQTQHNLTTKQAEEAIERTKGLLQEAEWEVAAHLAPLRAKGNSADAAKASEAVDAVAREQLKALTAQKNSKFDAIDPGYTKAVDDDAFSDLVESTLTPASRGDITRLPEPLTKALKEMQEKGGVTMGELSDLRPEISSLIQQAQKAGDGAMVGKLVPLMNFINEQVEVLAQQGDEAAAEAVNFYKNVFAPRFGQYVGKSFRQGVKTGQQMPSQTGRMFLAGPKEGAVQFRAIIDNAPDPQQGVAAARDFLSTQLALRLATASSDAGAGRVAKRFIDDYAATLQQFPEIRRELSRTAGEISAKSKKVSGLTESVRKKQADLKLTEQEKRLQAARYFLNADPVAAVQKVFNSPNPAGAMRELRLRASKDPNALKGLRAATKEYMKNVLMNKSSGEDIAATVSRFNKAFNDERTLNTMRQIFTPSELGRLRAVRARLNEMSGIDKRVTSNSITTPMAQDVQKVRVLVSSIYGIIKGRGVFMIGRWIGNILRGNRTIEEVAEKLITDAMLDPKLAATMLRGDSPGTRRELKTYLLNNYPEMFGEDSESEQE